MQIEPFKNIVQTLQNLTESSETDHSFLQYLQDNSLHMTEKPAFPEEIRHSIPEKVFHQYLNKVGLLPVYSETHIWKDEEYFDSDYGEFRNRLLKTLPDLGTTIVVKMVDGRELVAVRESNSKFYRYWAWVE